MSMQNNSRKFDFLIDEFRLKLTKAAYHLCGDKDAALDLVQDTFIDAYKNFDSLKEPEKAPYWLYTILRRKAVSYYNLQAKQRRIIEEFLETKEDSAAIIREIYIEQMAKLAEEDREILAGKYLIGLSYKELAEALDIKEGTIRVRCLRAKDKLREIISGVNQKPPKRRRY